MGGTSSLSGFLPLGELGLERLVIIFKINKTLLKMNGYNKNARKIQN